MKRGGQISRSSPLKRGTATLKRKTELRANKPLSRPVPLPAPRSGPGTGKSSSAGLRAGERGRLAPKRRRRPSVGRAFRAVAEQPCAVCGTDRRKREAHHLVECSALRQWAMSQRLDPAEAWALERRLINDRRNALSLCKICHARATNAHARVSRSLLPPAVFEFAGELGEWALIRLEQAYPANRSDAY